MFPFVVFTFTEFIFVLTDEAAEKRARVSRPDLFEWLHYGPSHPWSFKCDFLCFERDHVFTGHPYALEARVVFEDMGDAAKCRLMFDERKLR